MVNSFMSQNQVIRRTSDNGKGTISMVIPKEFQEEYGLGKPTDIIITKHDSGFFVKKLRTDKNE